MHGINNQTTAAGQVPVKVRPILGRQLQRLLGGISLEVRALLGAELQSGELVLVGLSPRQAARIAGVRMSDLRLVRNATPLERDALKRGALTLEQLRRNCRPGRRAIARFIDRAGENRVFDELDRRTAPAVAAE